MKRALLVGAGTLAGVAALVVVHRRLALSARLSRDRDRQHLGDDRQRDLEHREPEPCVARRDGGRTSGTTSDVSTSSTKEGTDTGDAVDVRGGCGTVRVEAAVSGDKVVDVTALAVPQNDPRSSQISAQAVPMPVEHAIAARSSSSRGSVARRTSRPISRSRCARPWSRPTAPPQPAHPVCSAHLHL